MPFFWRIEGKCLEGIVDLALFSKKEIFILDWQTNRIDPDKLAGLRELYRPQMAAYWKAVAGLTNASVKAAIYSTAIGQLVIYEDDQLETEWRRLAEALQI